MRIAAIGRTEILYDTILLLKDKGYDIPLIVTSKEAPEYTKTSDDLKKLANDINAVFIHTPDIQTINDTLKNNPAIDIAVSINYSGIIPQNIIDHFRLGILNAHGGDLPRYRGNACQAWAIINGEDKIGLCIHNMIGGELDNGNIIARDYHPVDLDTKVTKIWNWMAERTPKLFLKALEELKNNPGYVLEYQSKDPQKALRCYPRKPEDGQINWSHSNIDILRLINASNKPYAGAFCYFNDKKIIIWDAKITEDDEIYSAVSGQISSIGDTYVDVITGDGTIRLLNIEYDGKTTTPDMIIKSIRDRLK